MASTEPPRILVVARGHIGDLVLATPALRDIRNHYPSGHIGVLANEYAAGVLDGCDYTDEVFAAFAYESKGRIARWWNTARLLRRLRGRFDIVVSLWYAPATMPLIGWLIGARQRVGFEYPGRWSRFLTASAGFQPWDLPVRIANT
ncbi:MAG: glycosyltransferase family 9 protein, partial [Ilumatobacteraceae bacterium]